MLAQPLEDAELVAFPSLGAVWQLVLRCLGVNGFNQTAIINGGLPRMQCGVISSLQGPVTLKMLSSSTGSTGGLGMHFPLPFPFPSPFPFFCPCPLPPFLPVECRSPAIRDRRPTILLVIFSS